MRARCHERFRIGFGEQTVLRGDTRYGGVRGQRGRVAGGQLLQGRGGGGPVPEANAVRVPARGRQGGQRGQGLPDGGGRLVSVRVRAAGAAAAAAATEEGSHRADRQLHQHRDDAGETGDGRVRRPVSGERQGPRWMVRGHRGGSGDAGANAIAGERPAVPVVRRAPVAGRLRGPGGPVGEERSRVAVGQKVVLRGGHRVLSGGRVPRGLPELPVRRTGLLPGRLKRASRTRIIFRCPARDDVCVQLPRAGGLTVRKRYDNNINAKWRPTISNTKTVVVINDILFKI